VEPNDSQHVSEPRPPPPDPVPPRADATPDSVAPGGSVPPTRGRSPRRGLLIGGAIAAIVAVVVAVVIVSGGGDEEPLAAASPPATFAAPSPSPSPTVGPPLGFTAKGKAVPFGVVLTWSAPAGQSVQGYRISRGHLAIATVPSGETTYTDTNVKPGRTYTYGIVTRGTGILESDQVTTEVDVPVPPLSSARLEGNFNAKLHSTSQSGFSGDVGDLAEGWNFKPKCKEGACDVTWKDLHYKELKTVLARKGAGYKGSDSGKFFGQCSGVVGVSSVALELHVVKGRVIGGEWRATKLEGTLVESHPSSLGCVSGGVTFTATVTYAR
jgi:Fibronectin type III domain